MKSSTHASIVNDPDRSVVSFVLYRARKRRAALIAKADARRRRLINAFLSGLVIASFFTATYTLHQEQRIQQMEQRQ
jgi:hypothetical protein